MPKSTERRPVLPVHRRQIAFNNKVDSVSAAKFPIGNGPNKPTILWSKLSDNPLVVNLKKIWKVCTTSNEGSLSETFKLVGSSDESDARTSVSGFTNKSQLQKQDKEDDDFLDAVVVGDEPSLHDKSDTKGSTNRSETGSQPGSNQNGNGAGTPHQRTADFGTDAASNYQGGLASWLRCKAWPTVVEFFEPRLATSEDEDTFQVQQWHSVKLWAFCGSLYLVLNWVLYLILNLFSTRHSIYAQVVYYGGLTLFTVPTPFMIAMDLPYTRPIIFQIWFATAVWWCALAEVIQTKECGFLTTDNHCWRKDFLAMNYYATGLPAMMMFICSKRIYNAIYQLIFFILLMALIIPKEGIYARNVISFVVFSVFIQGLHCAREKSQRHMFLLAMQLRSAYRAKHKAQIAESKASFTKRRFANYIFHEVRVPLNNAVLAFQLLQSGNAFKKEFSGSTEVYALEQGLNMMKTVLNDVLDFEKMDSGHFETIPRPFPLHRSIRAILDQIQVQTESRQLVLIRHLDPRIDNTTHLSHKHSLKSEEGLWVVGSELRLHQVLTNLASNAIKYTPEGGGSIRITTEFLGIENGDDVELPDDPPEVDDGSDEEEEDKDDDVDHEEVEGMDRIAEITSSPRRAGLPRTPTGSSGKHKKHKEKKEYLNFRLEVQDSGPGIKPSDLVDDRLFQPFVQTSVGKSSGSGTGLGLAIVKQIIKLSGGRLGVKSRRGEGAKFWIELSYPIATEEEVRVMKDANALIAPGQEPWNHFFPDRNTTGFGGQQTLPGSRSQSPSQHQQHPKEASAMSTRTSTPPPPPSPIPPSRQPPAPNLSHPTPFASSSLNPLNAPSFNPDPLLVLVVDDDKLTRAMSSKLLTKLGCIVDTANDGKECLEMVLGPNARRRPGGGTGYDLICLDNFMPEMTGEEAVRELRANDRDDFVVGCTGNALTEDQASYREAGADEVLTKPIMLSEFKRVLGLAQQRRLERRLKMDDGIS